MNMLTSGEESKSSLKMIPLPWRIASSGRRGDVVGAKMNSASGKCI